MHSCLVGPFGGDDTFILQKLATPLNIPFLESSAVTKINVEEAVLALVKSALDRPVFFKKPRLAAY